MNIPSPEEPENLGNGTLAVSSRNGSPVPSALTSCHGMETWFGHEPQSCQGPQIE